MPTPSTYQTNGMPMGPGGLLPGLNAKGQISDIAFRLKVRTKVADYTVKVEESGSIFLTTGATAAVNFTLPKPDADGADGAIFFFLNAADQNLTVTSGTADLMVSFNDLAADSVAFSTSSEKIGGGLIVVGDGAKWHVFHCGANTLTLAT